MLYCERRDEIILPKQVCIPISLLMLPLLPGFVFGLLPHSQPWNKQQWSHTQQGDDSTESQNKFGILLLWLCSFVHMHLQALLVARDSEHNCVPWPWTEQVVNLRSGTGARDSSIQPWLSEASLFTLFIRPRNSYITGSPEGFKIKVWLPRRVTGSELLTWLKHIHPSQIQPGPRG